MARQHNPVPGISQQRQQFAPRQMQPIESLAQPMRQTSPEAAIQQQVHELALEIYTRLAANHIDGDLYIQPLSVEHLRQLAQHSQTASKAFFESMGVQFD